MSSTEKSILTLAPISKDAQVRTFPESTHSTQFNKHSVNLQGLYFFIEEV